MNDEDLSSDRSDMMLNFGVMFLYHVQKINKRVCLQHTLYGLRCSITKILLNY